VANASIQEKTGHKSKDRCVRRKTLQGTGWLFPERRVLMGDFFRLILDTLDAEKREAERKLAAAPQPAPQPPKPDAHGTNVSPQPQQRPRRRLWAGIDPPGMHIEKDSEES